jgi:hypothetical protein
MREIQNKNCLLVEFCIGTQWPGPYNPDVLSHWQWAAQKKYTLCSNLEAGPEIINSWRLSANCTLAAESQRLSVRRAEQSISTDATCDI